MKSSLKNMVLSLSIIAVIMGGILALVHQLTLKPISEAAAEAKRQALADVLPTFDNDPGADMYTITLDGDVRPVTLYPATKQGVPAGVAVETWTMDGFSGEITLMVGFDSQGKVTGYRILQHAETPGLGAKADIWFADPQGKRSIIGSDTPLTVTKDGGTVDGITAATITSRAFLGAVNRARTAVQMAEQKNGLQK